MTTASRWSDILWSFLIHIRLFISFARLLLLWSTNKLASENSKYVYAYMERQNRRRKWNKDGRLLFCFEFVFNFYVCKKFSSFIRKMHFYDPLSINRNIMISVDFECAGKYYQQHDKHERIALRIVIIRCQGNGVWFLRSERVYRTVRWESAIHASR